MALALRILGRLILGSGLVIGAAASADAQRKAPSVEPSVAGSVKEQSAPRIQLPQQQQPAPAAPQTAPPIQVDLTGDRIRLPDTRLSTRQRIRLAEGLAQRAVTGVGRPTILAYEKRMVSLPRKIETTIEGAIGLKEASGLAMRSFPFGRTFRHATLAIEVFEPAEGGSDYFLVDVHYHSRGGYNEDEVYPQLSIDYELNGVRKTDEVIPTEARPSGVFTFLMDANSSINPFNGDPHSFRMMGTTIILRAIEVRPVV